jgi:hypothetical protein
MKENIILWDIENISLSYWFYIINNNENLNNLLYNSDENTKLYIFINKNNSENFQIKMNLFIDELFLNDKMINLSKENIITKIVDYKPDSADNEFLNIIKSKEKQQKEIYYYLISNDGGLIKQSKDLINGKLNIINFNLKNIQNEFLLNLIENFNIIYSNDKKNKIDLITEKELDNIIFLEDIKITTKNELFELIINKVNELITLKKEQNFQIFKEIFSNNQEEIKNDAVINITQGLSNHYFIDDKIDYKNEIIENKINIINSLIDFINSSLILKKLNKFHNNSKLINSKTKKELYSLIKRNKNNTHGNILFEEFEIDMKYNMINDFTLLNFNSKDSKNNFLKKYEKKLLKTNDNQYYIQIINLQTYFKLQQNNEYMENIEIENIIFNDYNNITNYKEKYIIFDTDNGLLELLILNHRLNEQTSIIYNIIDKTQQPSININVIY